MVIPRFVVAAINGEPIRIYGDGKQTRVFCHVKDTVRAITSIILEPKTIGEVFNIGGIGEISILELALLVIEKTNSKSDISFIKYDDAYGLGFEDIKRRVPDISKIENFTGWKPLFGLPTIIDDVINYYKL
jgi:UDP-glucose 4-epimerase